MSFEDPLFSKFTKIMSFSHCVKQEQVATSLGITKEELFEKLIEWNGKSSCYYHVQDELIVKENGKSNAVNSNYISKVLTPSPSQQHSKSQPQSQPLSSTPYSIVDKLYFRPREPRKKKLVYDGILTSKENAIFEKLREWRRIQAKRKKVPAYIIVHDSVLKTIVHYKISSLSELWKVHGIGKQKIEKYGLEIIKILENSGIKPSNRSQQDSNTHNSNILETERTKTIIRLRSGSTLADLKIIKTLEESIGLDLPQLMEVKAKSWGYVVKDGYVSELGLSDRCHGHMYDEIKKLSNLRILNFRNNGLESLPEWIGSFTKLYRLNLYGNQLRNLPDSLCKLYQLKWLFLNKNRLTRLPNCIDKLQKLTRFECSSNFLDNFPSSIFNLAKLSFLNLSKNSIREIPYEIYRNQNLHTINLSNNKINLVPESISKLRYLRKLQLNGNEIDSLPNLEQLRSLEWLDIRNTRIREFPKFTLKIPSLKRLYIDPRVSAPEEADHIVLH